MTIVNYASSIVNKLEALQHDDNARVVIYDRRVFIVQATEHLAYLAGAWATKKGFWGLGHLVMLDFFSGLVGVVDPT